MALQKILKKTYIEQVFEDVAQGKCMERFLEDNFPVDESYYMVTPQLKQPEGLLDLLAPTPEGDFKSAVAIYDAYHKLTPLQAINAEFWESLALTDLFPYMQKRWNLREAKDLKASILNHFTVSAHGLFRHGLAGLWWLVYLTVDPDRDNRYELTEMLFKNFTLRYVRFGVSRVIQHKEAAIGILQYLKDNEHNIGSMESLAINMSSYFNKLGAVKQLTFLDREFFYNEMATHIEEFNVSPKKREKASDTMTEEDIFNSDEL
jgi:hypothetical protein